MRITKSGNYENALVIVRWNDNITTELRIFRRIKEKGLRINYTKWSVNSQVDKVILPTWDIHPHSGSNYYLNLEFIIVGDRYIEICHSYGEQL